MHKVPGSGEGVPPEPILRKMRIPLVQRARLTHRGVSEDVFTADIGLLGVFVERGLPLQAGEEVELRFALPGNEIPIVAQCRVAWFHAEGARLQSKSLPPGVGLAFVHVADADYERLRRHVLEHLRRNPAERKFNRQWPERGGSGE
jgi:Tfp pilus assembly protein PilZ